MTAQLAATLLLDPSVIEDPYPFYRRLHEQAPVWRVPDTDVFVVSSFEMVVEATSRIEDFSSNKAPRISWSPSNNSERLPVSLRSSARVIRSAVLWEPRPLGLTCRE